MGSGGGGGGGRLPPKANAMKRSQMQWKLLLFDELDFFSFEASLLCYSLLIDMLLCYSLLIDMLFILSQIKKHVFFYKPNQIIKWSGLKRSEIGNKWQPRIGNR